MGWGSNRQTHPSRSIGVVGTACRKGEPGNWGRPVVGEGSGLDVVAGRRLRRVSDRVVVLPRLGNASGGRTLTSGMLLKRLRIGDWR